MKQNNQPFPSYAQPYQPQYNPTSPFTRLMAHAPNQVPAIPPMPPLATPPPNWLTYTRTPDGTQQVAAKLTDDVAKWLMLGLGIGAGATGLVMLIDHLKQLGAPVGAPQLPLNRKRK
jgi:hypothetical protein